MHSLVSFLNSASCASVTFGSAASPVGGNNANGYRFNHIKMPYETCKEVKSSILSGTTPPKALCISICV